MNATPDMAHWIQIAITALISSAMGGVIGGLVAWGGIRIRLDHLEHKITSMSQSVVYKDVCEQCRHHADDRQRAIDDDIREIKKDVKSLLVAAGGRN